MIKALVEFIGTFIFFSVILRHGQAIPIGIALAAAIFFGGAISGGNFNPGVTFMMWLKNSLTNMEAVSYVAAQLLAGLAAQQFYAMTMS